MPIQAKVVPKERQQAIAQGRVLSAGTSRAGAAKLRQPQQRSASSSSSSSSSSESAESDVSLPRKATVTASSQQGKKAPSSKAHVDPLEDHAAYAKRMAKQEWLYATGQAGGGVPIPPPKPSSSSTASSPARKPLAATPQVSSAATPVSEPPKGSANVAPVAAKNVAAIPASNNNTSSAASSVVPSQQSKATVVGSKIAEGGRTTTNSTTIVAQQGKEKTLDGTVEAGTPAKKEVVLPPAPLPSELVTDEEERQHPGRRDYLRMLELLERPEDDSNQVSKRDSVEEEATVPPPAARQPLAASQRGMTLAQLTRQHYNTMYHAWLDADSDSPFLAYDHWERAEAMAIIDMAGGSIDPGEMHQLFRQKATREEPFNDPNLRFALCINLLEELVVSDSFERKVNRFLHTHHKSFVASMPSRAKGEFQHSDHDVFTKYGEMMETLVLGELQKRITNFDEMEFFDMLFQTDNATNEPDSPLSFALWEVLLSFLKFENFCELMDEYISVHYGVADTRRDTKARSVIGSLRKSPPPSAASSAESSRTAPAAARKSSTPTTAAPSTPSTATTSKTKVVVPSGTATNRPRPSVVVPATKR